MKKIRKHLLVRGIVQGVGFRPFLHRLAKSCGLTGWANNTSAGAEAELLGEEEAFLQFERRLRTEAPPFACLEEVSLIESEDTSVLSEISFEIRESEEKEEATLISPDLAICPDCERELFSPSDRRYRYPFINCTNCGPRYTIIKKLPYDRDSTVMQYFSMCSVCKKEYQEISDRRYHAQPDCCPDCGPQMYYLNASGERLEHPFAAAQKELARGGIVAVKGIGGIHLACAGEMEEAVMLLRGKKHRPEQPLALLCFSMDEILQIAELTEEEKKLLLHPARPIVLVKKRKQQSFSWLSRGERIGVMLPYSPIHLLLTDGSFGGPKLLVMTSANRPGCPVLTDESEAREVLSGLADGYLLHNRPIENRCDDSVVMEWKAQPYFFRRSRGYAPMPILAKEDGSGIYAFGAEQKGSFALGRENHIFLSPHIGDLKNLETADHYRTALDTYERLFQTTAELLVCDLHPDYVSTREAKRRKGEKPFLQVQHHWAHMASCMEDNGLSGSVFGIIWDGTGLGSDGSIWGGEFLVGDLERFKRVGSIRPIALPGGDKAVKEIGRIALSLLLDAGISSEMIGKNEWIPFSEAKKNAVVRLLASDFHSVCPEASSIGRLFDGVCALLFQKGESSYDGEGGMLVESAAVHPFGAMQPKECYPIEFYQKEELRLFDTRPLIRAMVQELCLADREKGREAMAERFMTTLCYMALEQCRALNREKLPVVLSGGVFQNRFLLSGITSLLEKDGFTVYTHHRVSAGDEGISLGQLAIGRKFRKENPYVSCTSYENKND